jgi:two-component system sensor histidine kinase GlrK
MSVSRRVVLSVGLLMVLAFGSLAYQLWVVMGMQRINEELDKVNFAAAAELLEMRGVVLDVESYSRKYFVLSSENLRAENNANLEGSKQRFGQHLRTLETALQQWDPVEEVGLLSRAWIDYQSYMARAQQIPFNPDRGRPLDLDPALKLVKMRIETSYTAVMQSIRNQVERNRAIGGQAQAVSLFAGGVFLIAGTAIAFLMLRSITTPLQQLTRGTRNISSGKFSHRLPEDGPLEFAELARDFNKMTEQLGELDQMKKDFVAHVSHELKAPLAAIRQTLAVTMEQIPGPINEQQRRLLQLSRNSAERLTAMVANLLDVSRLEAGTMEYEMSPQDLNEVARTVVDEFSLKAEERRIKISVAADAPAIPVVCDRDRMIQVVGNLIDNALKFAPPDSAIDVSLAYSPQNGASAVTLSVADKGPGVPDAHKKEIFEKFHQIRGGGKRAAGQGVGLGLAICKTIVDAHRGRIWVEDNSGGGSVFRMEMRAVQKQEAVKCEEPSAQSR